MTHLTQPAIAALDAGGIPVTLLEIDLPDGTTFRTSDAGRAGATAPYKPFVKSWTPITYGVSDNDGRVERLRSTVRVMDPEPRTLTKILTGENGRLIRGSAARLKAAIRGLDEADWWSRLTGIVQDWKMPEPFVIEFLLRSTADDPLRGNGNRLLVTRDDFDTAPDNVIGAPVPEIYGKHESAGTNVTGMLTCVRVSTNGDPTDRTTAPTRYLVGGARMIDAIDRWTDGASKTAVGAHGTGWFWEERNGHIYTTIGFASDPGESAAITVDAWGLGKVATPTADPSDDSGVIKNGIAQLRHFLTNFVLNDWHRKVDKIDWFDPFTDTILHRESLDLAMAYFERKQMFGARAVPSQTVEATLAEFAQTWAVSYFLNEEGELGISVNDPHTSKGDIYGQIEIGRSDMRGNLFALEPDLTRQTDGIRNRFFFSEAENEYLAARITRDPHRNLNREIEIKMPWSGAEEPSL